MKIIILISFLLIAGVAFYIKSAHWQAFGCLCLIIFVLNMNKIVEMSFGEWKVKFKELVDVLWLKQRHVEQAEINMKGQTSYISLKKEPVVNLIDIFWDNLYIQPEKYKIDKNCIVFDTQKESGLVKGQKVTVIYYDKEAIEKLISEK